MPGSSATPKTVPTVLVVDDSPAGRYSLSRSIRAGGFATIECSGGSEALLHAKAGAAAVVLDVHLPDLHGFEVCRLLRSDPATANLPIIHVSAVRVGSEDRLQGLAAGADAYYVSPVEPKVLIATLEALIRARSAATAVSEAERLFRGAFEEAPCAMALFDEKGRVAEANNALLRLLEVTRKGLVRRSLSGMVPAEWTAQVEKLVAGWHTQPWEGRFPVINPAGRRAVLDWYVTPHPTPGWSIAVAVAGDAA
jgi:PAS domain S-box-containing protein